MPSIMTLSHRLRRCYMAHKDTPALAGVPVPEVEMLLLDIAVLVMRLEDVLGRRISKEELVCMAKTRGLNCSGTKDELLRRLHITPRGFLS